jgi:glycosyltransferase involved in cell wall biosynthesis
VKVVFYTENYVVGGCDRFLVDLIRNLDQSVFTTCLAGNVNPTFDDWLAARLPSHLPRRTIEVSTLPSSRLIRYAEPVLVGGGSERPERRGVVREVARVGGAALRYGQLAPNYVRLRRLFRSLKPDVLHINNGGYPGGETCRLAALAARAEGVRAVVHFVHSTASPPAFPGSIERALDQRIDHATDLWLTAAGRPATALHERRQISLDRIETVHYGIHAEDDLSRDGNGLRRSDGRPVIAVVASFDPGKGHAVLLEALVGLKRTGFPTRTLLIGEGPERGAIEMRTAGAGLDDDVEFLGWRDDVSQVLSSSDLLVLPSVAYECLPYSILEAMAHGLPVVATDLAGIPEEVIDGVTGRVVPPGNSDALARAIHEIASDLGRAREMGANGRKRLTTHFSLEYMTDRMSEIYLRVAAVRSPDRARFL